MVDFFFFERIDRTTRFHHNIGGFLEWKVLVKLREKKRGGGG